MTLYLKLALYTVTLALIAIPTSVFFGFNWFLVFASFLDLIILFLGLSGAIDKITYKPLGYQVLGLSARILGSIYILFSLSFSVVIVGLFFNVLSSHESLNILPYIVLLNIALVIAYIFLPENENIRFGITRPWVKNKHQDKIDKIIKNIEKLRYKEFVINTDMDKFALVFDMFSQDIQINIYNVFNDRTRIWFKEKIDEAKTVVLNDDEIDEILNNILIDLGELNE